MMTSLPAVLNAGRFFTASEASRILARPLTQILRAVRTMPEKPHRTGDSKNSAILLSPDDLAEIETSLSNTK